MKRLLILAQRAGRAMRSPTASVYLLVFVNSAILTALFPLVPAFEDEFSLSKLQIGVLFAAGGLAFLLVAIPIGILADRVGARSITIVTAGVLVVAALGQALAVDFWTLVASRVVFAVGSAGVLTAGVSWLADSAPATRRSALIGGIMPIAGLGGLAGPAVAGRLEDVYGRTVPFLAWMCVAIGALVVVLLSEQGRRARHEHLALPAMFSAARAVPVVLAACLLFLVGGLAEIVVSTLTPLQLDENGLSSGEIGLAFAAGAAAFVLVSSVVARMASRPRHRARRNDRNGVACSIPDSAGVEYIHDCSDRRDRDPDGRDRDRLHDCVPFGRRPAGVSRRWSRCCEWPVDALLGNVERDRAPRGAQRLRVCSAIAGSTESSSGCALLRLVG